MLEKINKIQHIKSNNFFLIAGPCIIEDESLAIEIANKILKITNKLKIPFIFKGSYSKANRSRIDRFILWYRRRKSLKYFKKGWRNF